MTIAIFTCERHIAITKLAVEYYKTFTPYDITVVGPKYISKYFRGVGVLFTCDESIEGFANLKSISDQFATSSNWYLQQFLKIAFYLESEENVLIVDGDTIVSESVFTNTIEHNVGYYTQERIDQYNNLLVNSRVFLSPSKKSYICNFGYFERKNSGFYSENPYKFIAVLARIVRESQEKEGLRYSSVDFSEYQLNGQISEAQKSTLVPLKMFRRGDLLIQRGLCLENLTVCKLNELFKTYDCISYEIDHKSSFVKSLLAELYLLFRQSW